MRYSAGRFTIASALPAIASPGNGERASTPPMLGMVATCAADRRGAHRACEDG